jgi:tetratricopeptide (TPR) repeat protein
MRNGRYVTTVMMLAALAAVGCSNDKTSEAKSETTGTAVKPVVKQQSLPVTGTDDEEFVAGAVKDTPATSFADGEAAYHAKKYDEATAIFGAYTERRPDNAWGHYMLGLSAWKSGDFATSEKAFDKALSLDPRHVKSLVNSSRLFIDQKRHEDATDRLTRAAELDPESLEVSRLLARTYVAQDKTDEAIEAYRRVIELHDNDAWSLNNLGLLLLEAQKADDALPLFAKATELRKDVAAFHNNFGMALEHTGRFTAAAAAYSGALAADPGYEKAKLNLARVEAVKSGPEEPFETATTSDATESK